MDLRQTIFSLSIINAYCLLHKLHEQDQQIVIKLQNTDGFCENVEVPDCEAEVT